MRVALAGSGTLAAGVLESLLESPHSVVALIQNGRRRRGRTRRFVRWLFGGFGLPRGVLGLARENRVPVVYIDRMTPEELAPLAECRPDLILVAGFGIIFQKPLLDLPSLGCVNCHSSLLPRHRGPNPFRAVVLSGEPESGVTFHIMGEGIDDGDIIAQYRFPVGPTDTGGSVYEKASMVTRSRVVEVLNKIEADGLQGTPQEKAQACYDANLTDEELMIYWNRTARTIERLIRACYPFSPARFRWRNRIIHVFEADCDPATCSAPPGTVIAVDPYVSVATGQGALTIVRAAGRGFVDWRWPPPLFGPQPGDVLPGPKQSGPQ